jgi:hypothetical protein
MIFIVIVDPTTEAQTHMEWEGHATLEAAKKEFGEMRSLSFASGIAPLDGYVYEGTIPEYGNKAEKLDVEKFSRYANNWAMRQVQQKQKVHGVEVETYKT